MDSSYATGSLVCTNPADFSRSDSVIQGPTRWRDAELTCQRVIRESLFVAIARVPCLPKAASMAPRGGRFHELVLDRWPRGERRPQSHADGIHLLVQLAECSVSVGGFPCGSPLPATA